MSPRSRSWVLRLIPLLAAGTAVAQPPPSSVPPPPIGHVTFYTEPNYRGQSFVVEVDTSIENLEMVRDERNRDYNDRFRSVRVEGPVHVIIYQNARFSGASTWINRDTPDLGAYSLGLRDRSTWDRSITSLQVEPAPPGGAFMVWQRRDAERVVRAIYRDVFSREPDNDGMRFYVGRLMDGGWSENQLRDNLRRSDEFKGRDLNAIVRRAYREAFGRDADPSGLATYTRNLGRGQTEMELIAELKQSREGQDYHIGQVITKAYRDILKRDPDAAGMENYRRAVRDKAYDEERIRDSLRKSDEYRQLQQKGRK